jgi:hypothetical protein
MLLILAVMWLISVIHCCIDQGECELNFESWKENCVIEGFVMCLLLLYAE